jgi:thioredoxin reductase (NADPH)
MVLGGIQMKEDSSDLMIIGAGPAGLSAAIYARLQGLTTTVYGDLPGGNLYMIQTVSNYPGFNCGVPGMKLGALIFTQAQSEGANLTMTNIERIEKSGAMFTVVDTNGARHNAPAAIIATGERPKKLAVENADLKGIHSCAMCDGPLYRGKEATMAVIGGGDRGGHLCLLLSGIGRRIILLDKNATLKMSAALQKVMVGLNNIEIMLNTEVLAFTGEKDIDGVRVSTNGGHTQKIAVDAVFPAAGWKPNTAMIHLPLAKTPQGYLKTDEKLMTSCTGLYAAGDVRDSDVKQIVTSCADGARAAVYAAEQLRGRNS